VFPPNADPDRVGCGILLGVDPPQGEALLAPIPPVCPNADGAPNWAPPAGLPKSGAFGAVDGGAAQGEDALPKADVLPNAGVLFCPNAGCEGV
jgi:hypothetical protein